MKIIVSLGSFELVRCRQKFSSRFTVKRLANSNTSRRSFFWFTFCNCRQSTQIEHLQVYTEHNTVTNPRHGMSGSRCFVVVSLSLLLAAAYLSLEVDASPYPTPSATSYPYKCGRVNCVCSSDRECAQGLKCSFRLCTAISSQPQITIGPLDSSTPLRMDATPNPRSFPNSDICNSISDCRQSGCECVNGICNGAGCTCLNARDCAPNKGLKCIFSSCRAPVSREGSNSSGIEPNAPPSNLQNGPLRIGDYKFGPSATPFPRLNEFGNARCDWEHCPCSRTSDCASDIDLACESFLCVYPYSSTSLRASASPSLLPPGAVSPSPYSTSPVLNGSAFDTNKKKPLLNRTLISIIVVAAVVALLIIAIASTLCCWCHRRTR